MKKTRLFPFVFKVKGAKNYAFFDLLNHRLFQAAPEGSAEELRELLLKKKLAYDIEGVIPLKLQADISNYKKKVILREVQLRITGRCDANCRDCGEPCRCFKGKRDMADDTLNILVEQLKNLPVNEIVVTGGNPLSKPGTLDKIKKGIKAKKFKILYKAANDAEETRLLKQPGFEIVTSHKFMPEITESKIKADTFSFFYHQEFNPCWGNTAAVDVDGTIKPCLWSAGVLGNIHENKIRELIISGAFDNYWQLTKDKIETCNRCEFRYGCYDCRVAALRRFGSLTGKTVGCSYNPFPS